MVVYIKHLVVRVRFLHVYVCVILLYSGSCILTWICKAAQEKDKYYSTV